MSTIAPQAPAPVRAAPPQQPTTHAGAGSWGACLIPILAYILINLAYGYFNRALVHCDRLIFGTARCTLALDLNLLAAQDTFQAGTRQTALRDAGRLATEASARMYWSSSVVLTIVLAVFVAALAIMWTRDALRKAPRSIRTATGILAVVSMALAIVLTLPNAREFLLVQRVFTSGAVPPVAGEIGVAAAGWLRVITFCSVALLVVAISALLYRPAVARDEEDELTQRGQQLQWALYAGAATLIVALIEFRALFAWASAAATAHGRGTGALISSLADAAAASTGAIYAVALAALYFPALLVLRSRAARLYADTGPHPDKPRETWLQEHSLGFTMPRTVGTLVTVLSPLLAQAPIAGLLKLFG